MRLGRLRRGGLSSPVERGMRRQGGKHRLVVDGLCDRGAVSWSADGRMTKFRGLVT